MDVSTGAWFFTHVIAFLCLVAILRKFLWGPVVNLLDERTHEVSRQYAEIERLKNETEKSQEEYKAKLQEAHAEARELVKKAHSDAEKLREQLQSETQAQIEKARKEASERIAHETEMARQQLRAYVADLSIMAAEKFLSEGLTEQQKKQLTDRTLPEIENAASRN
jgi:F-type H+-transporting ATPase subunit b